MTEVIHPYFEDDNSIPPARYGVGIPTPQSYRGMVGSAAAMVADLGEEDKTAIHDRKQVQKRKKEYTRAR